MTFSPIDCQKRLRALHRAGRLTHAQFAVADALLWSCRAPGRAEIQVSYRRLAQLAHVARSTAQAAIVELRNLGVLCWRRTRLRVAWRLGVASRQWRNVYRFSAPATDTEQRAADSQQENKKAASSGSAWKSLRPHCPVRSVAEQLILLGVKAV